MQAVPKCCRLKVWLLLPESVTNCAHAGGPKVLQAQQALLWILSLSCSSSQPVYSTLITRNFRNRRSKLRLKLIVSSTAKARRMELGMVQALQKIWWSMLMKLLACLLLQVLLQLLCQGILITSVSGQQCLCPCYKDCSHLQHLCNA